MSRNTQRRLITLSCLLGIALLAGPVAAQSDVTATATWAAPTGGTPAVEYIVQLSTNNGPWQNVANPTDTTTTLILTYFDDHRIRIAGIDAQGRQGPFSLPSNTFNPSAGDSGPGQPGKPELF